MVFDTIESMRPKLKMYSSLQEAQEAATELSKEYEEKISKCLVLIRIVYLSRCFQQTCRHAPSVRRHLTIIDVETR